MGRALIVTSASEESLIGDDAVDPDDIWQLPPEPLWPDWHRDAAAVAAQTETVRADLERFLNQQLGKLSDRMRSGWWLLKRVQVRVDVCEVAPDPGALEG